MMRLLVLVCALLVSGLSFATIDAYQFKNIQDEERFDNLTRELRCPKCQNTDIAESDAGLAKDIKDRVYELMGQGKTDKQIIAYMVDRYGNFITYRPPMRPLTWFLWFGPFVLALIALGVILSRKLMQRSAGRVGTVEVTPEQHKRVQELLQQLDQTEDRK